VIILCYGSLARAPAVVKTTEWSPLILADCTYFLLLVDIIVRKGMVMTLMPSPSAFQLFSPFSFLIEGLTANLLEQVIHP